MTQKLVFMPAIDSNEKTKQQKRKQKKSSFKGNKRETMQPFKLA